MFSDNYTSEMTLLFTDQKYLNHEVLETFRSAASLTIFHVLHVLLQVLISLKKNSIVRKKINVILDDPPHMSPF